MSEPLVHPDVLTASEACRYLRLDESCETMEAARDRLNRFCREEAIQPIEWGKTRLFSRRNLDAFVDRALDHRGPSPQAPSVSASTGLTSDIETDGNGAGGHREG